MSEFHIRSIQDNSRDLFLNDSVVVPSFKIVLMRGHNMFIGKNKEKLSMIPLLIWNRVIDTQLMKTLHTMAKPGKTEEKNLRKQHTKQMGSNMDKTWFYKLHLFYS